LNTLLLKWTRNDGYFILWYNSFVMKIQNPLVNYEDKWVALTPDRRKVVAAGETLEEVDKKLKGLKQKDIILHYIPPFGYIAF